MNKTVYVHRLGEDILYIGSGSPLRHNDKSCRSQEHLNLWDQLEKVVLVDGLTTKESKEIEQILIDICWSTNKLLNLTDKVPSVLDIDWIELDKLLYYDESSPTFLRWKVDKSRRTKKDSIAGSKSKSGYFGLKVNGRNLLAHRIVWALINKQNTPVNLVIDHIDRNKENNNISNLRLVTQSSNNRNKECKLSNTKEKFITHSEISKSFKLQYKTANGRKFEVFSYSSSKRAMNSFSSKQEALEAAIVRRNFLIQNKIISD